MSPTTLVILRNPRSWQPMGWPRSAKTLTCSCRTRSRRHVPAAAPSAPSAPSGLIQAAARRIIPKARITEWLAETHAVGYIYWRMVESIALLSAIVPRGARTSPPGRTRPTTAGKITLQVAHRFTRWLRGDDLCRKTRANCVCGRPVMIRRSTKRMLCGESRRAHGNTSCESEFLGLQLLSYFPLILSY
jgi:hypothetical protein